MHKRLDVLLIRATDSAILSDEPHSQQDPQSLAEMAPTPQKSSRSNKLSTESIKTLIHK
jgi:energy-coupling factor transporter ATP-binding protein EcfA2